MQKLFINGKFLTQSQTGTQRYAKEIVAELDSISKAGELCLLLPMGNWTLPCYKNIEIRQIPPFKGILWEQITFPLFVLLHKGISLNLSNVAPILKPDFVTIHDTKIKSHPDYYGWKFRNWYRFLYANQIKRCKTIFTVSNNAKQCLLYYYPKAGSEKIIVTYDSWQHIDKIIYDELALVKYCLTSNQYYFAMGSLEPNKNIRWIAEIAKRNTDFMFVVAGSLNTKVFTEGLGFECPVNMKLLGFITDGEAKALMRNAKAFLFPSICEGFGMPPLEALSAGCPRVILSDSPVMHEIFEGNAIYVNPFKYDYNLEELLEKSECDVKSVLDKFSWKKSAEIIYSIISSPIS